MTSSTSNERITIRIIAADNNPDTILSHFRDVISSISKINFNRVAIRQKPSSRKKHHPLELKDEHIDVVVAYEKNEPIPTPTLVSILKLAGFDRPDVFSALEKNPFIDAFIWKDGIITRY